MVLMRNLHAKSIFTNFIYFCSMKLLNKKHFSENKLFKKIEKVAKSAGVIVIYPAVVLFYLFKEKSVPVASKSIIAAALAYFIFPADSIPDVTPIIGYSDDLGIMLVSLSHLVKYITPELLEKVKSRMTKWFGDLEDLNKQELKILEKINDKNEVSL